MAKFVNPTKVITGPDTRWSYCNAWEAKAINGGTPKFSVSLIIPKSDTRTIAKIKAATRKVLLSSRAMASLFRHSRQLKRLCVMEILNVPMMKRMQTATSSMQTPHLLPVSWTQIDSRSLTTARFTAVFMTELLSISTLSTPMGTRESPADSTIFRRLKTVSRWAADLVQRTTLPMKMMIFLTKK